LDQATIRDLTLKRENSQETLVVAEAKIANFSFFSLLLSVFNQADWLAPFAHSPIEFRKIAYSIGLGPLKKGSLNTLSLKLAPLNDPLAALPYGLTYLKLTDLALVFSPGEALTLEPALDQTPAGEAKGQTLNLGAKSQTLNGTQDLTQDNWARVQTPDSPTSSALKDPTSNPKPPPLLLTINQASPALPLSQPPSLSQSHKPETSDDYPTDQVQLTLDSLAVSAWTFEGFKGLTVSGLNLTSPHLKLLALDLMATDVQPWVLADRAQLSRANPLYILDAIGSFSTGTIDLKTPNLSFSLAKSLWVTPKKELNGRLEFLNFASSGPILTFSQKAEPELRAFSEALGQELQGDLTLTLPFESVATGSLALNLRDKGSLNLSLTAPGEFFRSLVKERPNYLTLLNGFGEGAIVYRDLGLVAAYQAALAKRGLSDFLTDQLAAIRKNLLATNLVVEPEKLATELMVFMANPQSFTLAWTPPPGFPLATLRTQDSSSPLANILVFNSPDAQDLAKNYAHVILNELNMTLAVNDRPPWLLRLAAPAP
jgi:hypothetical protein